MKLMFCTSSMYEICLHTLSLARFFFFHIEFRTMWVLKNIMIADPIRGFKKYTLRWDTLYKAPFQNYCRKGYYFFLIRSVFFSCSPWTGQSGSNKSAFHDGWPCFFLFRQCGDNQIFFEIFCLRMQVQENHVNFDLLAFLQAMWWQSNCRKTKRVFFKMTELTWLWLLRFIFKWTTRLVNGKESRNTGG